MSDVNDSDLLVLPRAEVEALLEVLSRKDYGDTAARIEAHKQLDALLADAPQVVDAGVQRAMRDSGAQSGESEYYVDADCPDDGTYRVLLIAADAAEEG